MTQVDILDFLQPISTYKVLQPVISRKALPSVLCASVGLNWFCGFIFAAPHLRQPHVLRNIFCLPLLTFVGEYKGVVLLLVQAI